MEINSLDALIKLIQSSPEEDMQRYIRAYGNSREQHGIKKGWERCNEMHQKLKLLKAKQLKSHVLEYDEMASCIPLVEFIKFFSAIEDELRATIQFDDECNKMYAQNLHDFIWNKLGDVKTDRRLLFAKS